MPVLNKLILNGVQYSLGGDGGVSIDNEFKDALLQFASKAAYIDDNGQDYYDDLYNALYPTVQFITCEYTQTKTVCPTDSLDSLKSDLVVTAHYDDSTSIVPSADYTLNGSLTVGTSTITVSYGGKTTTFTVTVTASGESFLTPVTDWNSSGATVQRLNSYDFNAVCDRGPGWYSFMFQGNLFTTTDLISGKSVRVAFDVEIEDYNTSDGLGFVIGVASWNSQNANAGSSRTGYTQQSYNATGSYVLEFDVADTNIQISASQWLGIFIYFNANSGATFKVRNLVATYR